MARKTPRPRPRPPSAPSPYTGMAGTSARSRPLRGSSTAPAPSEPLAAAPENLDEQYAYVKRDLWRILVLGALIFTGIFLSTFLVNT